MNIHEEQMIACKLRSDFEFEGHDIINYCNLSDSEIEMVRTWRNHEKIRECGFKDDEISPAEHKGFLKKLKTDDRNFYWVMKKDDDYLGVLSIIKIKPKHRNGYLGLYSNPFNGTPGVGSLLAKYLIKIAFEIAKLHTLKLEMMEGNAPAFNLYNKMGFKEEGRLKEFAMKNGKWKDVIIMGIINKETRPSKQ